MSCAVMMMMVCRSSDSVLGEEGAGGAAHSPDEGRRRGGAL